MRDDAGLPPPQLPPESPLFNKKPTSQFLHICVFSSQTTLSVLQRHTHTRTTNSFLFLTSILWTTCVSRCELTRKEALECVTRLPCLSLGRCHCWYTHTFTVVSYLYQMSSQAKKANDIAFSQRYYIQRMKIVNNFVTRDVVRPFIYLRHIGRHSNQEKFL